MIKKNIIANFAGKFWIAIISFAFIPLYIHFLGIELYGLLGFLLSLQGLMALLDLGLSYAAAREFARRSGTSEEGDIIDLLRTFEIVYWCIAGVIAVALIAATPLTASWVNYKTLDSREMHGAFVLFALSLAASWPGTLYSGALSGLEKQVALNVVNAVATTVRNGGAVVVLWLVSPTLEALLIWQAIINLGSTLILRNILNGYLPHGGGYPRFRIDLLRSTARYAAGVAGILVLLTLLSQMDKLLVARLVPLDMFGYYVLASTVALALGYFSGPVTSVLFPRMVKALSAGNNVELSRLYHLGSQLIALLVVPTGAVLAAFSASILHIWTRNDEIATHSAVLLSLLAVGMTFNTLVSLSYSLQASAGWNRLVFTIHLVSVVVMGGALFMLVPVWGATGAAMCWVVLYFGHLCVGPALMHRKLLTGEFGRWLKKDILVPSVGGVGVVLAGRALMSAEPIGLVMVLWMALVWAVATAVQLSLSSELRPAIARQLTVVCRGI